MCLSKNRNLKTCLHIRLVDHSQDTGISLAQIISLVLSFQGHMWLVKRPTIVHMHKLQSEEKKMAATYMQTSSLKLICSWVAVG